MIYSFDERKIGSAFGEDLYQKSFMIDVTQDVVSDYYDLPSYINNIIDCTAIASDNNTVVNHNLNETRWTTKLNYTGSSTSAYIIKTCDYYNDGQDESNAMLEITKGNSVPEDLLPYLLVTIQYTKREVTP